MLPSSMANETMGCYLCQGPPVVEVNPTVGGIEWLLPLCREHAGDGIALLSRMFSDEESEASCELWLPGQQHVYDVEDQGDGQG